MKKLVISLLVSIVKICMIKNAFGFFVAIVEIAMILIYTKLTFNPNDSTWVVITISAMVVIFFMITRLIINLTERNDP